MMLPALTVKQPWAAWIASGEKTIETRTWSTGYRGPLAICSASLPKGCGVTRRALCIVFLVHCRAMTEGDDREACCPVYDRAMAWQFAADRRIVLMARHDVRGQLGIWPLYLPESEFWTPDDKDLARRWIDWANERGMIERIQKNGSPQRHGDHGELRHGD